MICTGLPCLECGHEIIRDRRWNDARDRLMFCCNSCRVAWTNRGRDRRRLGPVGKQVIALAFDAGEVSPALVAETLGIKRRNAVAHLRRMWRQGRLNRVRLGVYVLPRVIEAAP